MANNYVLGRGRVYFDRHDSAGASTGYRYLGNTPALAITRAAQSLDHYDSDSGVKIKDKSVTLSEDMGLTFETDNISLENLALWFGGTTAAGATTGAITAGTLLLPAPVHAGVAYYVGHEVVSSVSAAKTTGSAAVTDFTVDAAGGLITFGGAGYTSTDGLTVTYDAAAVTTTGRINDPTSIGTIYGALKFVSDNPVGANQTQTYGYVKLTANGSYDLKGDAWQKLAFTGEVLRQTSGAARFTIDARTGA
jgi:hypothetical protein